MMLRLLLRFGRRRPAISETKLSSGKFPFSLNQFRQLLTSVSEVS